jgi:ABC-type sugar transport system permease subunit
MDTVTPTRPSEAARQDLPLAVMLGWRVIVAVGMIAATIAVAFAIGIRVEGTLRWVFTAVLGIAAVLAVLSTMWTRALIHRGRAISFFLDYVIAIGGAFAMAQGANLFNGLDTAAARFNESALFLTIIVLGWFVGGLAERSSNPGLIRRISRSTMAAGLGVLLVSMGLLPGLVEFATRLAQANVFIPLAVALLAGYSARLLWSERAARAFSTDQRQAEVMDGFLFVSPNLIGFLVFLAGPLLVSLFISLTDWDGLTEASFVGLENYGRLFSDSAFLTSLRNILVFGLVAVPASVIPGLFLAALLNSKLPGMKVFRAIYFLPSIAGVVGVTLIWKNLLNATVGFVNYGILQATEFVNSITGAELEAAQPLWISGSSVALFSVMIVFAWQQLGFNTVLFLAGMQGIDRSLYEAADIDGANAWNRFRSITVPLLKPTTVFVVTNATILALQLFNEPFILQAPSPPNGPNNATLSPVIYLYQNAFQRFRQGYAAAVAWALFALIFAITLIYFSRQDEEGVLSA